MKEGRQGYTIVRIFVQIFALEVLQLMQEAILHVEEGMRVVSAPQGIE